MSKNTGCCKKTKHAKFSEKRTFLNPRCAHARVRIRGVKDVRFSENLAYFAFLKLYNSPFCLITNELIKGNI